MADITYLKNDEDGLVDQLEKSLDANRCPHCGVLNPVIRAVPAYRSPCGLVVIFSCASCKRIINCGITQ